jgi:hypothetical protein
MRAGRSCYNATMVDDFRSQPMESQEGRGIARRAWDAYSKQANRAPGASYLRKLLKPYGARYATDLFGFWLAWHLEGGFEGLERLGMERSTIFRRIKRFRMVTGVHPDEFELPGVTIDVEAYRRAAGKKR